MTAPLRVEHFFRHEYGRLVATLARRVGARHIEAVEDAAQSALMAALETWPRGGLPDSPSAWLFRVAQNNLTDELRAHSRRRRILEHAPPEAEVPEPDDLLRLLFTCCDPAIPEESCVAFALKTLCGFDIREISQRLFTSEANVYKRLGRARARLRELGADTMEPNPERLPAVRKILYLLFTEAHLSLHTESALRRELGAEAIRLTTLLAEHPWGRSPESDALVALMHLLTSRMAARHDEDGGLLLLEEQDRDLWDQTQIALGLEWLARSARGDDFSRYHAEAAIAAEHCLAPSFHETRWDRIAESYALLERFAPSAIHRLNRAVAVAEGQGPQAGLELLQGVEPPQALAHSYQWEAVLADLHRRAGNDALAQRHREAALAAAPTPAIHKLLSRRLVAAARAHP